MLASPPVLLLLIGEAPPASGRNFHRQDSGLYRAVLDAFQPIDRARFPEDFAARGCRLIDLCPGPVDRLSPAARRIARKAAEPLLAAELLRLQPRAIVSLLRSIKENVDRAAVLAGWSGSHENLPYPGRWVRHREVFVQRLAPLIAGLPPVSGR